MIRMKKSRLVLMLVMVIWATLIVIAVALYAAVSTGNMVLVSKSDYEKAADMAEKYEKLYQMQETINAQFLWDVDEEEQMTALYKEAVDSLDDKYSYYMTAEEYKKWAEAITGTFYGIGVTFTEDDNGDFVILKVIEGGPAALAGMKEGDILLQIDGKSYKDQNKIVTAIRGKEGTSVDVTYRRGKKKKTVTLVRGEVNELSVYASTIDKKYGYIQITSFEEDTAKQFEAELNEMEQKGVKGLVIDLRNNPGGMMDQCIDIADMLLPEAAITYTKDKNGNKETYNSDEHCTKLKYVLLVNENSASAAEIVTAAVKDHESGKIVGKKTFGKGVIQGTMDLQDGSAMSLTIMEYFSPKGKKIHKKGVKPDYVVALPEDAATDRQLEKALKLLK